MATTSQLISSHTYHYVHLKSRAPVDGPKMNAAVVHESSRPMYFVRFSFVVHLVNKLVVTVMDWYVAPAPPLATGQAAICAVESLNDQVSAVSAERSSFSAPQAAA